MNKIDLHHRIDKIEKTNNSNLDVSIKFFNVLDELLDLINDIISEENQYFSSIFLKLKFIEDKYQLDNRFTKYFNYVIKLVNRKSNTINNPEKFYNNFFKNCKNYIALLESSNAINDFSEKEFELFPIEKINLTNNFKKLQLIDFSDNVLICSFDDLAIEIELDSNWLHITSYIWLGINLNFFNLRNVAPLKYKTFHGTLIIIEPDLLVDITEIAECFVGESFIPEMFILRRYSLKGQSWHTLFGNFVNGLFDELIINPEISFEEAYQKTKKSKILSFFFNFLNSETIDEELKTKLQPHFNILKHKAVEFKIFKNSLEPSFISDIYGLQGRLDLMYENPNDCLEKNILELKSGSSPTINFGFVLGNNSIKTGVWKNNVAQVTGYNLLLDSAYEKRHGVSSILYSSTNDLPQRNIANDENLKRVFVDCRNQLVAYEYLLTKDYFKTLKKISNKLNYYFENNSIPSFHLEAIEKLNHLQNNISLLEKKVFACQNRFILRELYSGKEDSFKSKNSTIYLDSFDKKLSFYTIIPNLIIDSDKSDWENFHLHFIKPTEDNNINLFRKGDQVIVYQNINLGKPLGQIIKGSIRELNNSSLTISLRNKLLDKSIFANSEDWIIEIDKDDNLLKRNFKSAMRFMFSPKEKRDLILGLKEPRFNFINYNNSDLLTTQNEIVQKALSAQDYFLIQGPPGSGKTSRVLKSIIQFLYENTDEKLIILSYTNRAIEEVCNVLASIPDIDYFRLGSKDSLTNNDSSFIKNLEEKHLLDVKDEFLKKRIFVSTTSFIMANDEFLDHINFDTAIIDEASQILETQIVGILSKVGRFIMIGDEKQLPAVVTQNPNYLTINDSDLNSIKFDNLSTSLFERLLKNAQDKMWNNAFDMLKDQARMHEDIQFIINQLFYNNQLETILNKQSNKFNYIDLSEFLNIENSRIIFINVPNDYQQKVNHYEVKVIDEVVKLLNNNLKDFNINSLGIISTFRAQCSEIQKVIDESLNQLITVDTVERYQGSERDIIIYSFACNFEFYLDKISSVVNINGCEVDRKLNVALSRAREMNIIIGCEEILNQNRIFNRFLELIKNNYTYIEYSDLSFSS